MPNPLGSKLCGQTTRRGMVCSHPIGPKGTCAAGHPTRVAGLPRPLRLRQGSAATAAIDPFNDPTGRNAGTDGPTVVPDWGTEDLRQAVACIDRLVDTRGHVEPTHAELDSAARDALIHVDAALASVDGGTGPVNASRPAWESVARCRDEIRSAQRRAPLSPAGIRGLLADAHDHLLSARINLLAHAAADQHLTKTARGDDGGAGPFSSHDDARARLSDRLGRPATHEEARALVDAANDLVGRIRAHRRRIAETVGRHPTLTLDQCVAYVAIDTADGGPRRARVGPTGQSATGSVDAAVAQWRADGGVIRRIDGTRIDVTDADLCAAFAAGAGT